MTSDSSCGDARPTTGVRGPARPGFVHLVVGIAGLAAFLLTGAYMAFQLDHLHGMPWPQRSMYRSAHIYLLFGAVHALAVGAVRPFPNSPWAARLVLLPVALEPAIFLIAFFLEPAGLMLSRPISRLGIYIAFASSVGLVILLAKERESMRSLALRMHTHQPKAEREPKVGL
ncbi:hypothetical protein [Lysobacter sp. 1R34A]|uniref:hypothetical protein n=1 Tax=Lysobacter sp. 1R34A TaxID=3445786 RepID=UPI003EE9DDB5